MNKITIYTNETCPYCKQVKEELTKNNIDFKEKLTKDWTTEWQAIVDLTGLPTLPTLDLNGEILVPSRDFSNPQLLTMLIKNHVTSKYSMDQRILEKVKTLNFSMYTAFTKTNQILTQIENKLKIENNEHESTS